jgi:amino acid transporter
MSTWAYFTGKLASATLLIHIFSLLLKTIIVPLIAIPTLLIDVTVLVLFMWLNHFGLQFGTRLTYAFVLFKLLPILTAIASSIFLLNNWAVPEKIFLWSGLSQTLPLVLYAFFGFETACLISLTIKDPQKNGPRVLWTAFIFTVSLTISYQLLTYLAIGNSLMTANSFLAVFPAFFKSIFSKTSLLAPHLLHMLHIFGAISALGGSYGIIMSNAWNLYTLADEKLIPFSQVFSKKNAFGMPFNCVLAEGIICLLYFLLTLADQVGLQQLSVIGCTSAFLISSISLFRLTFSFNALEGLISLLAIGVCLFLLVVSIENLLLLSPLFLLLPLLYLVIGLVIFFIAIKNRPPFSDSSNFKGDQGKQT